ncbi:alginate lyase family protein [bacterium]|nr:alginate lyase family protein [bacterium]
MSGLLRYCLKGIFSAKFARNTAKVFRKAVFSDHFVGLNLDFVSKEEWDKILLDAEELCKGSYQIYNYPHFIHKDWLQDPISGHRIKKAFNVTFIRISSLVGRVDVKNYWEMGHLHPVLTLAEAYWYTNNEKYAKRALEIALSFIKANPCGKTIHWKCCMDVAIRAVNLCQMAFLIRKNKEYLKKQSIIAESLAEHMIFISENYENLGDRPNNHYLTDLTGVIVVGVFLDKNYPPCDLIQRLSADAVERLNAELKKQLYSDGFDYENSSYYHCFVTELVSASLQTLKDNDVPFPNSMQKTCDKMLNICKWLGSFNQQLPLIGDQDGSRLYLPTGFFDFDRCNFSYLSKMNSFDSASHFNITDSGIVKLQNGHLVAYIKCGNIGTGGKGVHDHNDQLSVTVFYRGMPIVIDSGTYLYTKAPADRRKYRSTRAHSTLFIDGVEQNDIDSNLFYIKNGKSGKINNYSATSFSGEFTYESGVVHARRIVIYENEIIIKDKFSDPQLSAHVQFIIPENVKISHVEARNVSCQSNAVSVQFVSDTNVSVHDISYSPAYGVEITGHSIVSQTFAGLNETKISFSENCENYTSLGW